MSIYTKTGDDGTSALFDGKRISKDQLVFEAIGCIDELNSHIGLLASYPDSNAHTPILHRIQHTLFSMGATIAGASNQTPPQTEALENAIDSLEHTLVPLTQFILPTGSQASAQAQVCRSVARRLERNMVQLAQQQAVDADILTWLNRVSDYLFTLARAINTEPEQFWQP